MIAMLWAKFGKWVSIIGAMLVALASIFFAGRKSGKTKAGVEAADQRANDREAIAVRQINEQREASKREVETVKEANNVSKQNDSVSDADVDKRLRDEWQRD